MEEVDDDVQEDVNEDVEVDAVEDDAAKEDDDVKDTWARKM